MAIELPLVAAALGLLGFFEPCTVATHTLFAARVHAAPGRARLLALLLACRMLLLGLLFAAAAGAGIARPPAGAAAVLLFLLGAIYLATIRLYLPVPHLELFRLLPGGPRLPEAARLGLTLPACVLPLLMVVGFLAADAADAPAGALAGALFALLLTLPTVWLSLHGMDGPWRRRLARAAHASHYVTTALLWGGALVVWRGGL